MGTLQASYISQNLILHGRSKSTPIAVIGKGTTIKQKVIIGRLDELDKIVKFTINLSLLIIGKVVFLHKKLEWFNTPSVFNNKKNISFIIHLI
jgi:uroporphyrin-III C-methyltransferase/precorrin-2 dehydrogenase/sirohydrochlorin ferrochelatase